MYGGAAGGGKSSALLMGALQYVDVPGYTALILRRTYADLALPGALMDRAEEWFQPTAAKWKAKEKAWLFPTGQDEDGKDLPPARIVFGHLEHERHKYRYQSAEFQYIGFDELTQFSASQYRYLFSRIRRLKGSSVPLRMRSATNPGGDGHDWVHQRFLVEGPTNNRYFIPAKMDDNPHLDHVEYRESLNQLDPIERAQLLLGDWEAKVEGGLFTRKDFQLIDPSELPECKRKIRYWDLAATAEDKGKDPDWTSGTLLYESEGQYFVCDVQRMRGNPAAVERLIRRTAQMDGKEIPIRMEQEPGASGKNTISHYARKVLRGYDFRGDRKDKNKIEAARPLAAAVANENVHVIRGAWNGAFLDEICAFPMGSHDDQVDSTSGGFNELTRPRTLGSNYAMPY